MPMCFVAVCHSDCFSKFVVSHLYTENMFQISFPLPDVYYVLLY